jgi:hypothetical protein
MEFEVRKEDEERHHLQRKKAVQTNLVFFLFPVGKHRRFSKATHTDQPRDSVDEQGSSEVCTELVFHFFLQLLLGFSALFLVLLETHSTAHST